MTEPRKSRTKRTVNNANLKTLSVETPGTEPQWVREPRPVLPPLRVGREWDRVRRIAYL
jgi:hypothetical protein